MVDTTLLEEHSDSLQGRLARTEQALERAEQLAQAGRFAALVMHEINGPLEAVTNFAYLLDSEPLTRSGREYLTMMEEQLSRLREIAHQTLLFYRTTQTLQKTDVVRLIHAAVRVYQKPIEEKRLKVELSLPKTAMHEVYPAELTQAVSNLISNAIDASREGGSLSIRLRPRPPKIHITVCDTGTGVPLHIRASLFDAFASGKSTGHGIGLWICRRAIEKHGGRISWRSSIVPGRSGTVFRISLGPLATAPASTMVN